MAITSLSNRIRNFFSRDPDRFLYSVSSVIHVGANTGQERHHYEKLGLRVLWIEPIPNIFEQLQSNISTLPRQQAIRALLTDEDNMIFNFNIANNNGASSSILELKDHKDIWPHVKFVETIPLRSKTLKSLLQEQRMDPSSFDALILDTQGSELLILKGAESILKHFCFVKTEVADFESYSGCCQLDELNKFMGRNKFRLFSSRAFAQRKTGGTYYNVTYKRET